MVAMSLDAPNLLWEMFALAVDGGLTTPQLVLLDGLLQQRALLCLGRETPSQDLLAALSRVHLPILAQDLVDRCRAAVDGFLPPGAGAPDRHLLFLHTVPRAEALLIIRAEPLGLRGIVLNSATQAQECWRRLAAIGFDAQFLAIVRLLP